MLTGSTLQRQEIWRRSSHQVVSAGFAVGCTDTGCCTHEAYLVVAYYHGQSQLVVDLHVSDRFKELILLVIFVYYFAADRSAKYCDQRVCLSVCLSTGISQKPHVQISPNFMYVTCASGSVLLWHIPLCYVLPLLWITSRFSHIGVNGPDFARIKDYAYVSFSWPGGGTGGDVCRLRLHSFDHWSKKY